MNQTFFILSEGNSHNFLSLFNKILSLMGEVWGFSNWLIVNYLFGKISSNILK